MPGLTCMKKFAFTLMTIMVVAAASAQSYSIDWFTIDGGGGSSTGAIYQVTGTIGQPDASDALTGGNYSLTGGFWSLFTVVQTPGLPNLLIFPNGVGGVKILWPATGNYTLQQNANLATANWVTNTNLITTTNNTNSIIITSAAGNMFFRLKQ